ncbi:peroxisome assembly protein 12 [Belonocnema kinseyi]|uniref:peroxisome assembly protein 12 n=1 Tax=Belonocnema kinseyi TaxID=2817044 RepID=UPI00143DD92F|nr:peroxisome assembly protein 12 [Belonocnema kinseyi]
MGEKGVNLTGISYAKPSLFEIVAQESLASILEPAFGKVVSVLAGHNPEKYGWLLRWNDEAFLLLNGALQNYYLNRHNASFSEKFYGLKRVAVTDTNTTSILSRKQKIASLILLVLFPYINRKLEALKREYTDEEPSNNLPKWKINLIKGLIKVYTVCDVIREVAILQNLLLYISGKSNYPSPLLRLISVTLSYSFVRPTVVITDLLYKIKDGTFTWGDGGTIFEEVAAKSLEVGAFFLRFLQWWDNEIYAKSLTDLPTPVPPTIPEEAKKLRGLCPICKNAFRNRTALATSGYIFCYQCILPVIQRYGKCPVTNYPATEDDLIRLYVQ